MIDRASDLFVAVFGDAGRDARSAIGVQQLPRDFAVEIERGCARQGRGRYLHSVQSSGAAT